jgi:hypothetical protein
MGDDTEVITGGCEITGCRVGVEDMTGAKRWWLWLRVTGVVGRELDAIVDFSRLS